jgi:hypothetical protein
MDGRGPAPFGGGGYCPGGACIYVCGAENALRVQFETKILGTYVASDPSAVTHTLPLNSIFSKRR